MKFLVVLVAMVASMITLAPAASAAGIVNRPRYTVERTFGPFNGAIPPGDRGGVPDDGEAFTAACHSLGDSILRGKARVIYRTSHGTARHRVLILDVIGSFFDTENDHLKWGVFVGSNGKKGWNSVRITLTCRQTNPPRP